ncbi:hypothetical protein BGW41_003437 [Actinomortierella wolfii]|nr:hypothetical protein BGW41_003437 [Actinomortierella wolfii]
MDIEKATLKKAAVSILPLWADPEAESKYNAIQTIRSGHTRGSTPSPPPAAHTTENGDAAASGPPLKPAYANGSVHRKAPQQQELQGRTLAPSTYSLGQASTSSASSPPDWSVFATMSNVSTLSNQLSQKLPLMQSEREAPDGEEGEGAAGVKDGNSLRRFPPKLEDIFKSKSTGHQPGCTCNCPGTQGGRSTATSRKFLTSKRQAQKESLSAARGYPTGQAISTDPPEDNTWDENDDLALTRKQTLATNRTINMDALKGFVNSPFFSNVLKSMTVMAAVSVFAIALDSIVLLVKTPDQKLRLANDNACMIITVILSILTIAYSVFNIFLESRRPPEGLDTTRSKPLAVIISEIVASILWSQILSITIYMYIWTYGCTSAGQEQLSQLWRPDVMPDRHLQERLCRRQGAIVGLEAILVLLLIFNFYTHIEQNFTFIRAVS